jgi:hypothetical protein
MRNVWLESAFAGKQTSLNLIYEWPMLAQSGACILAVYLTAIDGATRTLQNLRPSFSVGWNLLVAIEWRRWR